MPVRLHRGRRGLRLRLRCRCQSSQVLVGEKLGARVDVKLIKVPCAGSVLYLLCVLFAVFYDFFDDLFLVMIFS